MLVCSNFLLSLIKAGLSRQYFDFPRILKVLYILNGMGNATCDNILILNLLRVILL